MPNYDFQCQECGRKFTKLVSISEKDQVTCPECRSQKVKQLYTGFGVKKSQNNCNTGCYGGFG